MIRVWRLIISFSDEPPDIQRTEVDDTYSNTRYINTERRGIKFMARVKVVRDDCVKPLFEKNITTEFNTDTMKENIVRDDSCHSGGGYLRSNSIRTWASREKQRRRWHFWIIPMVLSVAMFVSFRVIIYLRQQMIDPLSQIDNTIIMTLPIPNQEFIVKIEGKGFDPNIVQVVVTGPGCVKFGPCSVPNNVLQNYGQVTNTQIENIPLTLAAGDYQIYVQNGSSGLPSNSWPLTVSIAGL